MRFLVLLLLMITIPAQAQVAAAIQSEKPVHRPDVQIVGVKTVEQSSGLPLVYLGKVAGTVTPIHFTVATEDGKQIKPFNVRFGKNGNIHTATWAKRDWVVNVPASEIQDGMVYISVKQTTRLLNAQLAKNVWRPIADIRVIETE